MARGGEGPESAYGFLPRFVLTGNLSTLSRAAAVQKISDAGGVVKSGVSEKTDYLVYGEQLEDGRHYTEGSKSAASALVR